MKRALSVVVIAAIVCALTPPAAMAHGTRAGRVSGSARAGVRRLPSAPKSVFPQPVDPWKFWGVSPGHGHSHGGGNFFGGNAFWGGSSYIGTPSVVVTAPMAPEVSDATTVVYASPAMYPPAPAMPVSIPPALPTAMVVEHPGGWYQLRGDGVTTPYNWVWIPKAPAPPVASAEPAPPAQRSDGAARSTDSRAREDRGSAYHWTDDRGVTTWTNRLDKVPKRFREQAAASAQSD